MNQKETANHLGISVRSLQRYSKAGRLTPTYVPGTTRRVPVFNDQEVETLKATLLSRPVYAPQKDETDNKRPFGFRMASSSILRLAEEAARYGMAPGQYARHLVEMGLESELHKKLSELLTELTDLRRQISTLDQSLTEHRKTTADAVEAILEFVGMDHVEAERWCNINVRATVQKRCTR